MDKYSKPLNAIRGGLVWLAGIFGIGLIFFAWAMHGSTGEERELAARLVALPDVQAAKQGDVVVVAGEIVDSNPLLREEFVAFRRVQRQGGPRGGNEDVVIETGKQPLDVDTSVGHVRIVNDDYAFDERAIPWAAEERLESPAGLIEGAITILGFARGSPVVAVGTLEQEPAHIGEPAQVHAETLVVGPLDRLVEDLRNGADSGAALIPWMLGAAILLLLYAFWEGRRLYRD